MHLRTHTGVNVQIAKLAAEDNSLCIRANYSVESKGRSMDHFEYDLIQALADLGLAEWQTEYHVVDDGIFENMTYIYLIIRLNKLVIGSDLYNLLNPNE